MTDDSQPQGQHPEQGDPQRPAPTPAGDRQDSVWAGPAGPEGSGQQWWAAQSAQTPGQAVGQQPHPGTPYPAATSPFPQTGRSPRRTVSAGLAATALVAGIIGGGVGVGGGYLLAGSGGSAPTLVAPPHTSSTVSAKPGSVEYAARTASKSTVDIKVASGRTGDEGTGIILSGNGYILTNNHVVSAAVGGGRIQVTLPSGDKKPATIVGTAPSYDLAVIRVSGVDGLTPAQLGDSGSVRLGQSVAAIGSPFGYAGTVTSGIVSSLSRTVTVQGENGQLVVYNGLQTDAPINPGNSGGPLVNMNGQVIGVNSSISTGNSQSPGQAGSIGIGFSIPIDTARRVANQLMHQGYADKPVLGVVGRIGSGSGDGAHIAKVAPDSGAARAGIDAGDVITKVDGTPLSGYADLMAQILAHKPGQRIPVTVKSQGGDTRTVHVTLGSEKDQAQTTVPDDGQGQEPFGGFPFGGH